MTALGRVALAAWLASSVAWAAPATKQDRCAARLKEFDAAEAAAPGRCAADRDCACYSDVRRDNETRVADKASARRLQKLADAYRKRGCPTICVQQVAVKCEAECRAGTCVRR